MGCGQTKAKAPARAAEGQKKALPAVTEKKKVGDVKVYGCYISMNSMGAVMLAVEEMCGEMVPTFPGDATNTEEFLAMNPFHAIPTIKDGEFCLAESCTILRYMSMKYVPNLYMDFEKQRRATIDWAMDRFSSVIYPDVIACIYPILGFVAAPADKGAAGKKASENLAKFAEVFLKEKFIGGSNLSIADYKVAPFLFAFACKQVKDAAEVEIPERILQFNFDFKAKVPETYKLLSDAGGNSLKETLDSKTGGPEKNPLIEVKEGYKDATAAQLVGSAWNSLTDWMVSLTTGGKGNVKIHGVTVSLNCMGPLLVVKHAQVGDLEVCMPGEQSQCEDYKKLVPFGGVPGLQDGAWSMGESNAILRYLAREYAEDLYPADPEKRGRIDWAMDNFSLGMYNDCTTTIYVAMGFQEAPAEEEQLKAAGEKASKGLDEFAKAFLPEGQKFVAGDKLSIADFKVAPFFCAYCHDRVQTMCSVTVPDRIKQFNTDFAEACTESKLLREAEGGFSVMQFLDSKTGKEDPASAELQKAMEAEADKTVVELDPVIEKPCGCF